MFVKWQYLFRKVYRINKIEYMEILYIGNVESFLIQGVNIYIYTYKYIYSYSWITRRRVAAARHSRKYRLIYTFEFYLAHRTQIYMRIARTVEQHKQKNIVHYFCRYLLLHELLFNVISCRRFNSVSIKVINKMVDFD